MASGYTILFQSFVAFFVANYVKSLPTSTHVVNSVDGVEKTNNFGKAIEYMLRYGYLAPDDPRSMAGKSRSRADLMNAIKEVQRFGGLPVTGDLDGQTMKLMRTPRCGLADFGPTDNTKRRKRYAAHGTKWEKTELTYRILNSPTTNKVSADQVDDVIRLAFDMWSKVSPLTFEQLPSGTADIMISFEASVHDDGYPFDGMGGTIAHGFYPLDNTGLAGDVHFDDDELWVLKSPEGTDFFWTAIHEIGHTIGLDHSFYQSAIMYPFFQGYKENLYLHEDDVLGIQSIYGKPKPTMSTTPPPPMPTAVEEGPSACDISVDAVFHDRQGDTYFFKEQYYWKLDKYGRFSGAIKLQDTWPELRNRVQAAYIRPDGMTVFFKGRRYWVYDGTKFIEGPKFIKDYGLPLAMKQLDAVFVWSGNRKTYFFKDHQYWRYNEVDRSLDSGYPRNITDGWGVVPLPIDSVMTKNGTTYFFKGQSFMKYDFYNRHRAMVAENIAEEFVGCKQGQLLARNSAQKSTIFSCVLIIFSLLLGIVRF